MDTFDFFVLHNLKAFDRKDISVLPVFFLSDVFSGSTAGSFLLRHIVLSAVSFRFYSSCYSASTPSGNSSPGFNVFTRRKKYNKWHTHTIAIQILPIVPSIILLLCPPPCGPFLFRSYPKEIFPIKQKRGIIEVPLLV